MKDPTAKELAQVLWAEIQSSREDRAHLEHVKQISNAAGKLIALCNSQLMAYKMGFIVPDTDNMPVLIPKGASSKRKKNK
jgi:hypothetical protein